MILLMHKIYLPTVVYFYLNPTDAVISDVHTELIDLYRCIGKGNGKDIYEFMEQNPNEEKTYYEIRDEMNRHYIAHFYRFFPQLHEGL